MDHIKLWQISVCFATALQCLASSLAEDVSECSPRCWNPVQRGFGVMGSTYQGGVANEEECKELCVNNGTCIGVDWIRTDENCWFQLTEKVVQDNWPNLNHWSLANCTDDCASYCWKVVMADFHVDPGTSVNATDESHCKLICSNTSTCRGVDWNPTLSSCWLINNEMRREPLYGIRHWDIVRNLPTRCQTSSIEYFTYTSAALAGQVTSSNNTSSTLKAVYEYYNESTTGWKTATIVLAVLLGLCILIIIGLVLNTIKNGRTLNTKSDAKNTEMGNNYEGLQRVVRSPDPVYTDLVQANPNNELEANK